jgi:hypothetical protein
MLIEGSGFGSGSIPLTGGFGSGSGRPKNMWIRIHNTGLGLTKLAFKMRFNVVFLLKRCIIGGIMIIDPLEKLSLKI